MSAAELPALAACLTPPGRSAIATLAIRGPRAWQIASALFRPFSSSGTGLPPQPEAGRFWPGRLGQELADEVVLAVVRAEPVPWVEVHCHGGPEVVRLLLESLAARGAATCSWQELELRTAADRGQVRAAVALAQATTTRTAAVLLDQYQGAFSRALADIIAAFDAGRTETAGAHLQELARYAPLGRHLTVPWRVVVAGAPNVGKSSLVNALAGYQRSIVAATPGTTRDVVITMIAIDGWPVELADTAGLRGTTDTVEVQGMDRAREAAGEADLRLWVLDASAPPVWPDASVAAPRLVVNKIDMPAAWDLSQAADAIRVSARTGEGLAQLSGSLARWLVPEPPPAGAAVPFTPTLADLVEQSWRACQAGDRAATLQLLRRAQAELHDVG